MTAEAIETIQGQPIVWSYPETFTPPDDLVGRGYVPYKAHYVQTVDGAVGYRMGWQKWDSETGVVDIKLSLEPTARPVVKLIPSEAGINPAGKKVNVQKALGEHVILFIADHPQYEKAKEWAHGK